MLSLNKETASMMPFVLDTFIEKHRSDALEEIRNFILKQKIPNEEKRELFEALEKAATLIKENNGVYKSKSPKG